MDSGFTLRVLMLFITFGHHAIANVYRYDGRNVQPYFEHAHASPRSYKPASSYEGYSRSGSSESSRPSQGPSGAYGRQVDGYSRQGSVSNYRPASAVSKPRPTSQQAPGVYQSQASYGGLKFGSGVVSSGAIEIRDIAKPLPRASSPVLQTKAGMWNMESQHSGDGVRSGNRISGMSSSPKPSMEEPDSDPTIKYDVPFGSGQSSHSLTEQAVSRPSTSRYYTVRQQSSRLGKPVQRQPSSPAKPVQRQPSSPAKPVQRQPSSPAKPVQRQPSSPAKPVQRQPSSPAKPVQRQPSSPAKPVQRQSVSGSHIPQSKAGMWDLPSPFSGGRQKLSISNRAAEVSITPKPYQRQPGSLTARVEQLIVSTRDNAPGSSRRMDVETQNSKPVPVASLYKYEGQRPQLRSMNNRNRQSLAN